MKDIMIGVDLAKNVYQLHGATMTGQIKFGRKLLRGQFLRFIENQPAAVLSRAVSRRS
jgi:transposase